MDSPANRLAHGRAVHRRESPLAAGIIVGGDAPGQFGVVGQQRLVDNGGAHALASDALRLQGRAPQPGALIFLQKCGSLVLGPRKDGAGVVGVGYTGPRPCIRPAGRSVGRTRPAKADSAGRCTAQPLSKSGRGFRRVSAPARRWARAAGASGLSSAAGRQPQRQQVERQHCGAVHGVTSFSIFRLSKAFPENALLLRGGGRQWPPLPSSVCCKSPVCPPESGGRSGFITGLTA